MKFKLSFGVHTVSTKTDFNLYTTLQEHLFQIEHASYTKNGKQPPFGLRQENCIKNAQKYCEKYILNLEELHPVFASKLGKVMEEEWAYYKPPGTEKHEKGCYKDVIVDGPLTDQLTRYFISFHWDDMSWGHWWEAIIKEDIRDKRTRYFQQDQ